MARPVEKRADIERAVVEVVALKGLAATTIYDIATHADVSQGLLYRYWENRDALAADVYGRHYEALVSSLLAAAGDAVGAFERLRRMVRFFYSFAERERTQIQFLLLSQHDLVRGIPGERGVRALLMQLLEQGQARGEVREMNAELAMHLMLGIILQPVIARIYGTLPESLEAYADQVADALVRALGVSGE